jgi:hypothetical protein
MDLLATFLSFSSSFRNSAIFTRKDFRVVPFLFFFLPKPEATRARRATARAEETLRAA